MKYMTSDQERYNRSEDRGSQLSAEKSRKRQPRQPGHFLLAA